jgi:cephalosporin hydroxylase
VDIRAHNRAAIEAHPLAQRSKMIQGSSNAPEIAAQVHETARGKKTVLVFTDSNYTPEHVAEELRLYSPLFT